MRSRLQSAGRTPLRGGFGRLSGGSSLASGRSSLAALGSLGASPGSWRRLLRSVPWLALLLLIAAVFLASESLNPAPPRAPDLARRPPASSPTRPAPAPVPLPQRPGPAAVPPQEASPPTTDPAPIPLPTEPEPSYTPPVEPDRPEIIHELIVNHIHRLHIMWIWDWLPIGLIAALFPFVRQLIRRQPRDRYLRAAAITLAALSLSGLAVAAGVNQLPGPGRYEPHPRVVIDEHRNSKGDLIIEEEKPIDHYHPPLELDVALLLLAAALADLSVPPGRIAVTGFRGWMKSKPSWG